MELAKYNPLWAMHTFNLMEAQGRINKPHGFPDYDSTVDWAGPSGEENARLAATIPESLMGVSIKRAAFRHDLGYGCSRQMRPKWCRGQRLWRFLCDRRFRWDMLLLLERADPALKAVDMAMATKFAKLYYWAVRLGGRKHCVK